VTLEAGTGLENPVGSISATARVVASGTLGLAVGLLTGLFALPQLAALIGWDVAVAAFLVMVWSTVWRLGPEATQDRAVQLDPRRRLANAVVIVAGVAVLAAVALALVRAGHAHGETRDLLVTIGLVSVASSWLAIQTVFTLRYAELFYQGKPGGIDFNEPDRPNYVDFAYLTFTVGMTFQVSDTNITSKLIRRTALAHALISYFFGAVILAVAINLVASLL
jgi:uncharacterized membrane protein